MGFDPLAAITIGFAIFSALIVIWYLLRRPLLTRSTKITLLFGIGLLPLGAAMSGNYAGFEATKERRFCGSCHVMTPYSNDSGNPKSETLAARHGRNEMFGHENCYACHADYGMFGTITTKIGGMRHVYLYLTEYHSMSLDEAREKIHIIKPFSNEACMRCHSTRSPVWNAVGDHASTLHRVRAGTLSCASDGCHGPAHPFSKPTPPKVGAR